MRALLLLISISGCGTVTPRPAVHEDQLTNQPRPLVGRLACDQARVAVSDQYDVVRGGQAVQSTNDSGDMVVETWIVLPGQRDTDGVRAGFL